MENDSDFIPETTQEESKEIKAINKDTVHRICSGQVVLSLAVAMKELVENSVDAGANRIDIHLKEFGSELIEVSDNGCGVHEDNFKALTLKHYTSKIREFEDLEQIGTLGFRGEALSSLCALSDVEIVTRHKTAQVATRLVYDYGGNIVKREITARQQGTTVTLKNLFSTLPVRKKDFSKNLKKEFSKMCNLLYAYCLLPNGIKYTCNNITVKGLKSCIVSTEGSATVRENLISVFGIKQLASLVEVATALPDCKILEEYGVELSQALPFELLLMISSAIHGSGRSSSDRQFFYINSRPCEPAKLMKLVNEVYRNFNNKQYPFVYLNIITKSCYVDVNITPDKRQVFLEKEKLLLAVVKASLLEAFKEFPSTFKTQNLEVSQTITCSKQGVKRPYTSDRSILSMFGKRCKSDSGGQSPGPSVGEMFKKIKSDEDVYVKPKKIKQMVKSKSISEQDLTDTQREADEKLKYLANLACSLVESSDDDEDPEGPKSQEITIDCPPEDSKRHVPLHFNFNSIKEQLKRRNDTTAKSDAVKFRCDIAGSQAEAELNKHISKSDFNKMEIIGQFNLGFIIAKLNDDLFIVDQHATDEKYNFEQLQLNTIIDSQKLVTPKYLELTASAKTTLLEFEQVFRKNGFAFNQDGDKIYLTSIPMSDKYVFGKSDIDEMIFMLQEDSSQDKSCRPSRIRAMFASRACRKSVMIGKSLSRGDMRRLVDHMGDIEQPWNCPHGRPTMRHLVNLNLITDKMDKDE